MIIGPCPNCGKCNMTELEHYGAWYKIKCPKCRRLHWIYNSRFEPKRISLKEFKRLYYIDKNGEVCDKIKKNDDDEALNELKGLYGEELINKLVEIASQAVLRTIMEDFVRGRI